MTLIVQIKSLVFSFLFGILFSFLISICEKKLYKVRIRYQIINSCLFCIINALVYFIILKKINNGIIHVYFILSIIVGVIFEHVIIDIIKRGFKRIKKRHFNFL